MTQHVMLLVKDQTVAPSMRKSQEINKQNITNTIYGNREHHFESRK